MPFTSETSRKARARSHGLRRAAFWRKLGFSNLEAARELKRLYRASRLLAKVEAEIGADATREVKRRLNQPREGG